MDDLTLAVRQGWVPEPPELQTDLAIDPAFASIKSAPEFERARQAILRHFAKERADLGPVDVSYLKALPY